MANNYRPDRPGTGDLMRSLGIRRVVEDAARVGQGYAESISPDAPDVGEGYISSFRVETGEEVVAGERRAVAYLVNDAAHAAAVEARHRVLSRTVDFIENA